MSEPRDDRELEEYLRGGSDLSRRYREAAAEQPSTAADEAILAAARRAVQSRPVSTRTLIPRHWVRPLSMAALIVLSATLVITVQREDTAGIPVAEPAQGEADSAMQAAGANRDQGAADAVMQSAEPPAREAEALAESPVSRLREQVPPPAAPKAAETPPPPTLWQPAARPEQRDVRTPPEPPAAALMRLPPPGADIALPERARKAERELMMDAPAALAPSVLSVPVAEDQLREISALWAAGERELALRRLREFLAEHPHYADEDLRRALPPELYVELHPVTDP